MEKLSKEEIKKTQLNLLKFLKYICEKNSINYFINYGTLLGAVRHKGFIPWDDDVDISMYREDYNKLIEAINIENHPKYKIINYYNSNWYFHNFSILVDVTTTIPDNYKKIRQDTHLFIDIFPIDKFNSKKIFKRLHIYNSLRRFSQYKKEYIINNDSKIKDFIRISIWYILYFVNPRFFTKKIEKIINKNIVNNGEFESFLGMGDIKEVLPLDTCKELINLEFENISIKAPKKYDKILTTYYGDYMKLPPKDEQLPSHDFEVYKN